MTRVTEFLITIGRIMKLHDSSLKVVCSKYGLSLIEAKIIRFLHNNPGLDTAGDIVELLKLSKGNVSQAIEELIQKSLLTRRQDTMDRRKIHLTLQPEALPITQEIERQQKEFQEELFTGFTEQERELFERMNDRLRQNAETAMERRLKNE